MAADIPQLPAAASRFPGLRQRAVRARLWPLSRLARFFWLTLTIAVFLNILALFLRTGIFSTISAVFYILAYVIAVPSGLWLAGRWIMNSVLWRVRNRLIVTYLFIGGAPILLLLTLALISAYFLAGQFASFLATTDLKSELESVTATNQAIASHIQGEARSGRVDLADIPELRSPAGTPRVMELFGPDPRPLSTVTNMGPDTFDRPSWLKKDFQGIVREHGKLFFRAARFFAIGNRRYTVISSEPLDSNMMAKLLNQLGQVEIFGTAVVHGKNGTFFTVDEADVRATKNETREEAGRRLAEETEEGRANAIRAGALPPARGLFDRTFSSASPIQTVDWRTGDNKVQALSIATRLSVLYERLFSASAVWGSTLRNVLFGTSVFFGLLELFAFFVGMRLTRSITHAVYELYNATQHIERGEFRHRIRLRSTDQLAALEASFNTMSGSLERLLIEQREKERLQSELVIAQEVQEQLFPRAWTSSLYLDLFGICRPARTVSGDYYDFLPLGPVRTGIAVGDISGKGISAALLMATIQSAVRSYEFGREVEPQLVAASSAAANAQMSSVATIPASGHSPADAMWLLNRHLYQSTPPEKYATMFLAVYDGETRTLSYTNGGHLPPIVIRENGSVEKLEISGTVIGLFEDARWEQNKVDLAPGDLVVAYSDGITEPENEYGEFGEDRLISLLQQHRSLPLEEIARLTITAVIEWIGESEQPDDITVVLARPAA